MVSASLAIHSLFDHTLISVWSVAGLLYLEGQVLPQMHSWLPPAPSVVGAWHLQSDGLAVDGNTTLSCCEFCVVGLQLLLAAPQIHKLNAVARLLTRRLLLLQMDRQDREQLNNLLWCWRRASVGDAQLLCGRDAAASELVRAAHVTFT